MLPPFFNTIEPITLFDPLSQILGAPDDGLLEIHYHEIAKMAGHSCPTVAGAYLMSKQALDALYNNETPRRGEIEVTLHSQKEEGVTGVMAMVMSNITGASDCGGFKGFLGQYPRADKLHFEDDGNESVTYTRVDTQTRVNVTYTPSLIPISQEQKRLIAKIKEQDASPNEIKAFSRLWQARVKAIFEAQERVVKVTTI